MFGRRHTQADTLGSPYPRRSRPTTTACVPVTVRLSHSPGCCAVALSPTSPFPSLSPQQPLHSHPCFSALPPDIAFPLGHCEGSNRTRQGSAPTAVGFPSVPAVLTGRELSCLWARVTIHAHRTRITRICCFVYGFVPFLLRKR